METFTKNDWQEFLDGKIAVNCPTFELSNEFISSERMREYCEKRFNKNWHTYSRNTCYTTRYGLSYCYTEWFKSQNCIVKEFKGWEEFERIEKREAKPKPPLGVMPKYLYEEKRIMDLCRALYEYSQYKIDEDTTKSMTDWTIELCERLNNINK
jgi:hypothetical protein